MDLLTKYRPVRSLEFYQRKVVKFIHGSEGSVDLRSLGIPYGELGFDSPLHFIRCIPPEMTEEFLCDKLFQRMDKTLRKGNKVFLTSDDGRIQSAVYKGQKLSTGEAILDGHRSTYPMDDVIPYKAFLRKNVGTMLIDGPHKIIGSDVTYAEPKWEVGDSIYYKPSKRWGVIEDRDVVRGKVFCEIKLEKSKLKKEKIVRMGLWELMSDAVPYRTPLIPKNNANAAAASEISDVEKTKSDPQNAKTKIDSGQPAEILLPPLKNGNGTINRNKLRKEVSKESEISSKDISFRKSSLSGGESDSVITVVNPALQNNNSTLTVIPTRDTGSSSSSEAVLIDLHNSPKLPENRSEVIQNGDHNGPSSPKTTLVQEPTTVRRNPSRTMRPLTEYFHSKSVEVHDDDPSSATLSGPDLKFKSVNNLTTQASEEEEFSLEKYSNSLRRSARNVLAKQVAVEAARKGRDLHYPQSQRKKVASLSTDNLNFMADSPQMTPVMAHVSISDTDGRRHTSHHRKMPYHHLNENTDSHPSTAPSISTSAISTSANDTSGSESPPPPPLPMSLPPLQQTIIPQKPVSHSSQNALITVPPLKRPSFDRAVSVMEPIPRNYENSNFRNGSCSMISSSQVPTSSEENWSSPEHRKSSLPIYSQEHYHPHTHSHSQSVEQDRKNATYLHGQPHGRGISSSVSSYYHDTYQNDNPQEMEFPSQFFHHAVSVPSFDAPDSSMVFPHSSGQDFNFTQPESTKYRQMSTTSTMEKQRKYKKNPSTLKSRTKSVPNFVEQGEGRPPPPVEPPLPQPFTIQNIQSAAGKGRGIQTGYHSGYADVTLFSLFYCSNIFDKLLTTEVDSDRDRAMKQEVKKILRNKIVRPLRISAYCSMESILHLKEALLPICSKLNSSFMDCEEFLSLLFETALNIPEFIQYSNGTKEFMHSIIVRPKDRSRCQDIQSLFQTSMDINNLQLKELPLPALMLCIPRCNGKIVYYEAIIPTMRLNITPLIDKGSKRCLCEMAATFDCAICYKTYGQVALSYCSNCQKMAEQIHYHMGHTPVLVPKTYKNVILSLLAVVCIKNQHYSTFVKTGVQKDAPWLYYEARPNELPQVLMVPDFGRILDKLEREPARYREFAKKHLFIKRILTEAHICVYFSPEASTRTGPYAESFMI